MEKVVFDLTINEAMEEVFDGRAVQGENFLWNCYLTARDGVVIINEFHEDKYPA